MTANACGGNDAICAGASWLTCDGDRAFMASTGLGADGATVGVGVAVGVCVVAGVGVGLMFGSITVTVLGLDEPPPLPGEEDTGAATVKLTNVAPSAYVSV